MLPEINKNWKFEDVLGPFWVILILAFIEKMLGFAEIGFVVSFYLIALNSVELPV